VIFMMVVYFLIVVPYRGYMKRRGTVVYGPPPPTKTCPYCQSSVPLAATKCAFCTSELAVTTTA
jgi:large conductance mechanosensitive channel